MQVLRDTANEAAVPVLLAAFNSSDEAIAEKALRAILGRSRGAGQGALMARWHELDERRRQLIAEHPRRISAAVRDAILSTDTGTCANGCDALLRIREYELIPALVAAVEQADNPQGARVARTLVELAALLRESLDAPRGLQSQESPSRQRHFVLPSLQQAVDRFDQRHGHLEVVEAFLILTPQDNSVLRGVLREPRHPAYLVMMQLLSSSVRAPVIRLVLNFLEDRVAPTVALHVVSHRTDGGFVRQLLRRLGACPSPTVRGNLKRIEDIAWFEGDMRLFNTLNDDEQVATVRLALHAGINRLRACDVISRICRTSGVRGRREASAALAQFGGADANQLVLEGLSDPDPQVQANMAAQLRARGIPGAITRLVQLLGSDHAVVRQAAGESLTEFRFRRYIANFDMMEDEVRRDAGQLVMRIDPDASAELAAELKSQTHARRLRGLAAAVAMGAVPFVEPLVIGMLGENDHFLRAEAARTLGQCDTRMARRALQEALRDPSHAVREAAEAALHILSARPEGTAAPAPAELHPDVARAAAHEMTL